MDQALFFVDYMGYDPIRSGVFTIFTVYQYGDLLSVTAVLLLRMLDNESHHSLSLPSSIYAALRHKYAHNPF